VTTKNIETGTVDSLTFHILGAPLYVAEDTAYPGEGDGKSIYPFALASGTYGGKFSGNNGGELARQARFRVFNPHGVTVPVVASVTGFAASGVEEWDARVWSAGTAQWDVLGGACTAVATLPCLGSPGMPEPYQTSPGGNFFCEADTNPQSQSNAPAQVFSSTTGQRSAWTAGNESVPAEGYLNRILVPPAFGTGAGSVVVYVGRPFGSYGLPPDVFTTLGNPDGVTRYYRFVQDAYVRGALLSQSACNCDTSQPPVCDRTEVHAFDQRRWTASLSAANETYSGQLSLTSYALVGPTQDLGEGTAQAVPFSGGKTY
jgi:hypothetical protein